MNSVQCIVDAVRYDGMYAVHCTVYNELGNEVCLRYSNVVLCIVVCTVYSVHYTVYSEQCTVNSVQC